MKLLEQYVVKKKSCSQLSENKILKLNFWLKPNSRNAKHNNWKDVTYGICERKTSVYILKPCWEIGQSFEERLQGDNLLTVQLLKPGAPRQNWTFGWQESNNTFWENTVLNH